VYLTDQEIEARLEDFSFEAEPGCSAFDPGAQIGPCSVDLRLSNSYWKPEAPRPWRFGRALAIDLTRGRIMEANPNRGWRRISARATDHLVLKPGDMLLARTCETFSVPSDCAAAIEGRSSYARLGLSVHASGGFINPGYAGRMPLTLINHSPFTLKIPVGIALCQVMFIKLKDAPKLDYAGRHPKYLPDLGGPSYWWRDEAVRELHARLSSAHYDDASIGDVIDFFAHNSYEYSVYERMERFLSQAPSYGTADDLLDAFAKSEQRRFWWTRAAIFSSRGALPAVGLGVAIPFLLDQGRSSLGIALAAIALVLSLAASTWGWWQHIPEYLTTARLEKLRRQQQQGS
jgi:deoxycytidine triphosphate deaminase